MTAIFVQDEETAKGIANASFDHHAISRGRIYDVSMDGDILLLVSAPGYNSTRANLLVSTIIALAVDKTAVTAVAASELDSDDGHSDFG
jgi:hypothetical protein